MDQHTKFALDFQQWLFDLMANDDYTLTIHGELGNVHGVLMRSDGKEEVAEVYEAETPTDAMKELMKLYPQDT